MCGRFAQYSSRDEYSEASEASGITADELPHIEQLGRYNIAPCTQVMILNKRHGQLKFDRFYRD